MELVTHITGCWCIGKEKKGAGDTQRPRDCEKGEREREGEREKVRRQQREPFRNDGLTVRVDRSNCADDDDNDDNSEVGAVLVFGIGMLM